MFNVYLKGIVIFHCLPEWWAALLFICPKELRDHAIIPFRNTKKKKSRIKSLDHGQYELAQKVILVWGGIRKQMLRSLGPPLLS